MALALPGARTVSFFARASLGERRRGRSLPEQPHLSAKLLAKVAVDETLRTLMVGMAHAPTRRQRDRIGRDVADALELYEDQGWLARPESFHRRPPELCRPKLLRRYAAGLEFEQLSFQSRYHPRLGEPGRERWLGLRPNRTAHAWVLRHPGPERPWLISIPGYRMGRPSVDFGGLRAAHYHLDLGLNVLIPVLPLHGPRSVGSRSGDGFISADPLNTVHAEAQAMWDIRRMLDWIRREGAPEVGVWGVSLGGYNTALLAGLEGDLACAIAGIPASCFADLVELHLPGLLRWFGERMGLAWESNRSVMRVVSPLAIAPRVPRERRYIFAGLADRLIPPEHVLELWEHWQQPRIAWYNGSHLSFSWETEVRRLMYEALSDSGLLGQRQTLDSQHRAVA